MFCTTQDQSSDSLQSQAQELFSRFRLLRLVKWEKTEALKTVRSLPYFKNIWLLFRHNKNKRSFWKCIYMSFQSCFLFIGFTQNILCRFTKLSSSQLKYSSFRLRSSKNFKCLKLVTVNSLRWQLDKSSSRRWGMEGKL